MRGCAAPSCPQDAALLGPALAWVLRNRAAVGAEHRRLMRRPHPEFGDGGLVAAARGLARSLTAEVPAQACITTALLARLSASDGPDPSPGPTPGPDGPDPTPGPDGPDPTMGALYVHGHRQSPAWALGLRATALIGPCLFLTLPSQEHPTEKESPHARNSGRRLDRRAHPDL